MLITQKIAAIIIGSLLIGIGINGFLVPHHLIDGGVDGAALIMHYYFDFKTGLCILLFSIPLCMYAWFYKPAYFYSSFHGLLVSAFFIDLLDPLRTSFDLPIFLSSLIGGCVIGIGIGIMLRNDTSTGGTDLLARLISDYTSLNIGIAILLVDGLVVLAGYKTLELRSFVFSCITIAVVGLVTSIVMKPEE
ncbi:MULTISPECIES: YitT family protein [Metabacillus]|uniref:YitT family protein n=1 Tax=Metabacillus indicus TaxID=246786 RepID=A0A084H114_METID|nr:YitT family protein [Metabacillus indicus]KEZ53276.1 hypothetical protein GS18_0206635 [Metabacillus indicus]